MKKSLLSLLLFFTCSLGANLASKKVDLVVFSYNRPMQLYAFLESVERHIFNVGEAHVIFRSDSLSYTIAYDIVQRRFPNVRMYMQQDTLDDFKLLLMKTAFISTNRSPYVMFATDDMIITEKVDLAGCAKALKKQKKAWCFSLRLGKNITFCRTFHKTQKAPKMKRVKGGALRWKFSHVKETGDWDYPNTTATTIYRKRDIRQFFTQAVYENPKKLKEAWAKALPKRPYALCFDHSKAVHIPINAFNPKLTPVAIGSNVDVLLDMFLHQGQKLDIDVFYKVKNSLPDVNYDPKFCKRSV
jgi:hypothetical protein